MEVHLSKKHGAVLHGLTQEAIDDSILLTSKQVRARVGGVSEMCIWRWLRDARVKFPQPIKINKRNYWLMGDLRRWQKGQSEKKAA